MIHSGRETRYPIIMSVILSQGLFEQEFQGAYVTNPELIKLNCNTKDEIANKYTIRIWCDYCHGKGRFRFRSDISSKELLCPRGRTLCRSLLECWP